MKTNHTLDNELLKMLDFGEGDAPTSRRDAIRKAGRIGGGLALAALPLSSFLKPKVAFAQGSPVEILNYALTLEHLEDSYYRLGAESGIIPAGDATEVFDLIGKHETSHVEFLTGAVEGQGGDPVSFEDSDFDFTAGGNFNPFEDYGTFLLLAQAFEDTGVRAYKGQAPFLVGGGDLLTAALQIHSLEARHAAQVRRMRVQDGAQFASAPWIVLDSNSDGSPLEEVYGGATPEENVTQAGVSITGLGYSNEEASASFDEPLSMEFVLGIAQPFFAQQS